MRTKARLLALAAALAAVLAAFFCGACAKTGPRPPLAPSGQATFAAYAVETRDFVSQRKKIVSSRPLEEIAWNSPMEWRPVKPADKGVLLIHGLGDSPFSFIDVGPLMAEKGFLARAILLPGCGTNPEDLIGVELDDWRRTVSEQVELLRKEVRHVYLGGFSTGANLALDFALIDNSIEGLVLFSPAFKSTTSLAFLAPLAAELMDWVVRPRPGLKGQSPVRYDMVPADSFALWYHSTQRLSPLRPYPGPALVILSEKDSVVDALSVASDFDARFPHPKSRLIWYGSDQKVKALTDRLLARPGEAPKFRVDNFSHMGALFSPDNPEYGPRGAQRLCRNGQGEELFERCLSDPEVRYSAYGAAKFGQPSARLTFNPWFDWQAGVLFEVWGE
jgi:esterase/lipase